MTGTLAQQSRAEGGTIDYRVAIDADDPNRLRFFERYEGEAAFGARTETDHFGEFAAALPDLRDGAMSYRETSGESAGPSSE